MNGELKDVARANIIQLKCLVFHNRPMPAGVYRVSLARVLPGCDNVDPPIQPEGADSQMVLGECIPWPMLWPKSQIRLGAGGSTPQTTPPVGLGPSHGKATAPPPPSSAFGERRPQLQVDGVADLEEPATQQDDLDDDVDRYIHDRYDDEGFMAPLDVPPYRAPNTHEPSPAEKAGCSKRLFGSQDTPPAGAFTQEQTVREAILSPNTLLHSTRDAMLDGAPKPKKVRKRNKKSEYASGSQPPAPKPIRFKDGPGPYKNVMQEIHVAGLAILPKHMLDAVSGDMKSLHDSVLTRELQLLKMNDPAYPVFAVKVPEGMGFVEEPPADVFFLRFDAIFNMFHLKRLDRTMVRLFALSMAHQVIKEKTPRIAIVDPYYMIESNFSTPEGWLFMTERLQATMAENKKKDYILLPYFPE